jgi:exoribonuclease R
VSDLLRVRLQPKAAAIAAGFDRIRAEAGIPEAFPPAALEEAAAAAARGPAPPAGAPATRRDRRALELVTIDPPGARDLDQALLVERVEGGHRVRYAIADVASFVAPGGAVDAAARERGVTVYMPDRRTPLHPDDLGEGAASLLPGADRPALLWSIDLDDAGEPVSVALERATVRSRGALSYEEAQARIDAGDASLAPLRELGLRRLAREAERGGVSLTVPAQEVTREGDGYALAYDAPPAVEDWNAQVSLLTGMCAAEIMVRGGVGLFRTLAPAEPRALAALRRSARALGVAWPDAAGYPEVVRGLDPRDPGHAAFAVRASRSMGGAGYAAWTAGSGEDPPRHAALAARYAHVTAPIRRLADRVANEIVLAICERRAPPPWALDALREMPAVMRATGSRARAAERAAIDYVEAVVLASRASGTFRATVIDVRDDRPVVQLADPAVVAPLDASGPRPGDELSVRVASADPETRTVVLVPA